MTESALPMTSFLARLVSLGVSGDSLTEVVALAEAAFGGGARARASTEATREKWRLKAARRRARVPGDIGGQYQPTIIEVTTSKSVEQKKKVSKGDSTSPDVPGDKPKRSKGDVLPEDWKPTEDHYRLGEELKFTRQQVDGFAHRMRDWAISNAHRGVARKAGVRGWNAAFRNWLSSAAERQGGSNGASQGAAGGKVGFSGLAARLRQRVAAAEADLPFEQPAAGPGPADR